MPPGVPVATVSLGKGGAKNAAILAGEILALKFPTIADRLKAYREKLTKEALEKGKGLNL
jgi:5-(carboxyamino)imidazole ribonucleotide mutase